MGGEGQVDDDAHTLQVTLGAEKSFPSDGLGDFLISSKSFLDLVVFELNQRIFSVTLGVVVSKGLDGFFITAFADEPKISRG